MLIKIKAILATIKTQIADIWNRSKIALLAIAGIVLALEFRKLKEFLLVYAGQKEIKKDQKQDQDLANKENDANKQANALIQQAEQLPDGQPPVKLDWYKDSK